MNQQTLDQLIGSPPPSTVDVDAIVGQQQRRRRWRRITASAAAVAVVIIGVSLISTPRTKPPALPPAASPSVDQGLKIGADRQRTLTWLRTTLEKSTAEVAPDAKWIYMPDVPGEKRTPDGHPRMWSTTDPIGYGGRSGLTANGRKGGFYLSVHPADCPPGKNCAACDPTLDSCQPTTTPGGLQAFRWTDKPDHKYLFYGVQVMLRGGWTLSVQAVNYFGGDGSPVSAPTPALTRTQLDSIAAGIADRIEG
jgi:hypothetical protein